MGELYESERQSETRDREHVKYSSEGKKLRGNGRKKGKERKEELEKLKKQKQEWENHAQTNTTKALQDEDKQTNRQTRQS